MHQENAFFTEQNRSAKRRQSWNAFCESGSVSDYLRYREICNTAEDTAYADTCDSQGTGDP